jgi:Haem-binding uptake, Tiki superfamily, ChaN
MASTANLRSRRSAAERHALAGVEREIRAVDAHGRRKYLREFNEAFRTYESLLDSDQISQAVRAADIVLIGDYHALPAAQHYAASLLEQRALAGGRPVVVGVETIFARDQHILDEWWRREIDDSELRQRIRFDIDWGYDWAPFHEVLVTARDHAEGLYGLDCMPREDLRKIGARDRHAAAKIAEIRARHSQAAIVVLFGESHLAPTHLPRAIRQLLPEAKTLTVLQNIDALYWRAGGERADKVEAVRVHEGVICVFTSTPLEKYESYRLFLDQWSRCDRDRDFAPTIYNLIDTLAGFLEINRYSPHNGTQPKFLIDMLPEVHGPASEASLWRTLANRGITEAQLCALLASIEARGGAYIPQVNSFCIRDLRMVHAAEDVARFLHHACQGLPSRRTVNSATESTETGNPARPKRSTIDDFYTRVVEHAVAYFGSRVLYPSRPDPGTEAQGMLSRAACSKAARAAARAGEDELDSSAQHWGYRIGSEIYDAYLAGKVTPRGLRRLFLVRLDEPGVARNVCAAVISKLRALARPLARAAHA